MEYSDEILKKISYQERWNKWIEDKIRRLEKQIRDLEKAVVIFAIVWALSVIILSG